MSLKGRILRHAVSAERILDGFRSRHRGKGALPPVIDPYIGYSTPAGLVVRGRVLHRVRRFIPRDGQSWLTNMRQMIALFLTQEVAGIVVQAPLDGALGVTDGEGYFSFVLPYRGAGAAGGPVVEHVTVEAQGARAILPVNITGGTAAFGVISDIDDTVLKTGAWSFWRTIWTLFTGNALTRHVYPDAVALMRLLSDDGRNPVFYVSSSPWNLHGFLVDVFDNAGLASGPMFLRDYGIGDTQFVTPSHGEHKAQAIDTIMAANPGLAFVLIGDTGQHDAEIYAAAAQRHPERIAQVILRAQSGRYRHDGDHATGLRALGVPVAVDVGFDKAFAGCRTVLLQKSARLDG